MQTHPDSPPLLDRAQIQALIPHAGSMCLLDAVLHWDADGIECAASSHRAPDNPLRRGAGLPITAGIEYAAQAMAVHGGLMESPADGAPRRGYLAVLTAVRWSISSLDQCAAPLSVRARRHTVMAGGTCYSFSVSAQAQELLAGEAVIALA